jgi:hypothetical protein
MGSMVPIYVLAVMLIVLIWLDMRDSTRPLAEGFYDSGATLRLKSTPTTIDPKYGFDPRSLKDPRFFRD